MKIEISVERNKEKDETTIIFSVNNVQKHYCTLGREAINEYPEICWLFIKAAYAILVRG